MAPGQQLTLERLLTRVAEYRASDLHLTVAMPPVLRVDGRLVTLADEATVTPDLMNTFLEQLLTDDQRAALERDHSIVFTYALGNKARFKANIFYQRGYPSASLRYIASQIRTVRELGLPPIIEQFARMPKGLVIISGTFGSGRSATLAALVDLINRERAEHILTIERPIEHLFINAKSVVEQREVGHDTGSFENALENSFQEDVNVVMLSELEGPSVTGVALKVAESGRLVLSTMNTDSAVRTVEKIITSFPRGEQDQARIQLAEVLQGVVAQRLLPRNGGGSVVAAEVLTVTPAIRSVIRDGVIYQINTILQTSREEGMVPLDRALAEKVRSGEILIDEALAHANDRNGLKLLLRPSGY